MVALRAFGVVTGLKQFGFLGVNDEGKVAIYRGLPYELPFGIDLYSEQDVTTASLPLAAAASPGPKNGSHKLSMWPI